MKNSRKTARFRCQNEECLAFESCQFVDVAYPSKTVNNFFNFLYFQSLPLRPTFCAFEIFFIRHLRKGVISVTYFSLKSWPQEKCRIPWTLNFCLLKKRLSSKLLRFRFPKAFWTNLHWDKLTKWLSKAKMQTITNVYP